MTKEEIMQLNTDYLNGCESEHKMNELFSYALDQQPCDDAVSRKAVDELSKELVHTTRDKADFLCNFWEGLQKLPPVTPQQKHGKWIAYEVQLPDRQEEHPPVCICL